MARGRESEGAGEGDMIDNSSNVMRGKAVKRSETTALGNSLSARLCQFRIKLG